MDKIIKLLVIQIGFLSLGVKLKEEQDLTV